MALRPYYTLYTCYTPTFQEPVDESLDFVGLGGGPHVALCDRIAHNCDVGEFLTRWRCHWPRERAVDHFCEFALEVFDERTWEAEAVLEPVERFQEAEADQNEL